MSTGSPFHEGEQRVQTRLGVREAIEPWARRVVRSQLPEEHRAFYAELPFLVVAARDAVGRPWVTLLAEGPGFVSSPDAGTLRIATSPSQDDALAGALRPGKDVGLLGIELASRRRNRANGRVTHTTDGGVGVAMDQTFGNCPQYITERTWRRASGPLPSSRARRRGALSTPQRRRIERADTFFIATGYRPEGQEGDVFGMDASHRGGAPGFVGVPDERHL
ncbi:MAG: pyridoxamine 5'-phosphate oxidase family protein, partial [Myxococcota bacterium]